MQDKIITYVNIVFFYDHFVIRYINRDKIARELTEK